MRTALWTGLLVLASTGAALAEVLVIAHPDVPADTLRHHQLVDIYTRDLSFWDGDVRIVVCDLKRKGDTKRVFYAHLGKTTSQMKSIWMRKLLLGEGEPPEALEGEDEVLEFVARTPGAIGYVDASRADGRVKPLVMVGLGD